MMNKIFAFDNTLGYQFGSLMWLTFYIPSLVVLLADTTKGVARDYLAIGSLLSVLSFLVYTYYFFEGRPASTPSQVAITSESLARWILAAYYVPSDIVDSSSIGVMNGILLTASALFLVQKMVTQMYLNFNQQEYLDYERGLTMTGKKPQTESLDQNGANTNTNTNTNA